jgi:hypothetical protein
MEESNKISTILQCFVDTNLELNENLLYAAGAEVPTVFFPDASRVAPENTSIGITVSLSEPSIEGLETVTVVFIPGTATLDDVGVTLSTELVWARGEQTKTIFVEIKKDFEIEDGRNEAFQLALVGAVNCLPVETNSSTAVFITDTTVFNDVSLLLNEGASVFGSSPDQYLKYTYDNDSPVTLTLGLSNISEAGIEKFDLKIYTQSTPHFNGRFAGLVTSIPIEFEIGEQTKNIVIENIADSVLTVSPVLVAKIENTVKVNINQSAATHRYALMYVEPNSLAINRRWTTLNLGSFYRQKGPSPSGYMQLRSPVSSEIPQDLNDSQNGWNLKYGNVYNDNTSNEDNGFASANYEGFPLYRFGPSFQGSQNDIVMEVTNNGEYDILWDESVIQPGDMFEIPVLGNNYEITLPSNANLIEAGETIPQTGVAAQERLYADSQYTMSIKYNNPGYTNPDGDQVFSHGFTLQNGGEGQISIGNFQFTNYGNVYESQINQDYLTSYYISAETRYNGYSCTDAFNGPENVYNIRMLGAILLDDTSPITTYGGFEFIKLEEFSSVCGGANTSYLSPLWLGIPFEIA